MINLLYVQQQERNRSKEDVIKPLTTKILHFWFLCWDFSRPLETAQRQKRKGPPVWQDPTAFLEWQVSWDSREREEETSILGKKPEGEALRNIINKLSDERNMEEFHFKHYHMSNAQFKKRTTHLDILGRIYDFYQHVKKTCPFCNSTKPRTEWSRVSWFRAEEFGDLIFLDHGSANIGDKFLGFLIILDGATSHLTAYLRKSTSTSEVIAKPHEWMDTFQMNPEAICATYGFPQSSRHAGILPNAQREENSNRTTYTMAEPSRDGCTIVQEVSLDTRETQLQRNWTRPLWHRSLLPSWCARRRQWEVIRWFLVVRCTWNWPWDEDQEISWTQLQWIQSSWHPHQPSRIFSMKKF